MLTRRAVVLAKIEQHTSTLQGGSTDTVVILNSGASDQNDYYVGFDIKISGETRTIISYVGSSRSATLNLALSAPPSGGTEYSVNTYGIDSSPDAANCVLCTVPGVRVDGKELMRDFVRDTLSRISHRIGDKEVEVTFETELKGSGSPGVAPEIDALLRVCGMQPTTVSGSYVSYVPKSDFLESATVYVYKDGILHKVVGCVGDLKLTMPAGEYGKFAWTLKGKYASPITQAIPSVSPNATLPPTVTNAGLTISGYSPIAAKLDLELNNTIAKRIDMNQPDAVRGFFLTGRDPGGTVDPESIYPEQKDFWGDWEQSYAQVLEITISGGVGNVVRITSSGMVLTSPGYEDRDGLMVQSLPFKLSGDDNELAIRFM